MPLQRDVRDAMDHEAERAAARRGLEAMLGDRVEPKKPTPIGDKRLTLISHEKGQRVYEARSSRPPFPRYEIVVKTTRDGVFVYHRTGAGRVSCPGSPRCWHITQGWEESRR